VIRSIVIWSVVAAGLCIGAANGLLPAAGEPLSEPFLADDAVDIPRRTYGDARNVKLLAGLLGDPSATAREKAVYALGRTHNVEAIPHIRSAMSDAAVNVRCAAAAAASEYDPNRAADVVLLALRAESRRLVLTGLRCVRRMRLAAAAGPVKALLARENDLIRAAALVTLSELEVAAAPEQLKRLLESAAAVVRLRACENAILLKDLAAVKAPMLRIAREDAGAIRAAALAAMGRRDYASIEPLLAGAAKSDDAMVRRGAVWAYHNAGKADRIRPSLFDRSPMVLLAAIRAARDLRPADCAERLFELMRAVRDDTAHYAARDGLRNIAGARVEKLASKTLADLAGQLPRLYEATKPEPGARSPESLARIAKLARRRASIERDMRACSWLLGELKSAAALDVRIALLRDLPIDSPVLIDVAISLGKLGDRRAIGPLLKALETCRDNGLVCLQCIAARIPPTVPYNGAVAGGIAEGLARLGAQEALPVMIQILRTDVSGLRLDIATRIIVRELPRMATPKNRALLAGEVTYVLEGRGFTPPTRFRACISAGRLKAAAAIGALRKILHEDRQGWFQMRTAAWAIQTITGKTPVIPDPKVRQGDWIITTVKPRK